MQEEIKQNNINEKNDKLESIRKKSGKWGVTAYNFNRKFAKIGVIFFIVALLSPAFGVSGYVAGQLLAYFLILGLFIWIILLLIAKITSKK